MLSMPLNLESPDGKISWCSIVLILAGILWIGGIIFVEYFFYCTKRLRNLSKEQKEKYGAFSNEPERWNRLVFYLFSVLILPRFLGFFFVTFFYTIAIKILMIGVGKENPLSGWRKAVVKLLGRLVTRWNLFCKSFIWITNINDDIDYSPWLGPNWKTNKIAKPAIIICNHMSWTDILTAMTTDEFPAFVSSSHVKKIPLVNSVAEAIGSVFVNREDTNSRTNALEAIKTRVECFNANPNYPQLWIFPEGCTTNGKHMLRFKRGAFETETPVQPIYLEYYSPFCSVSYDTIPSIPHFLIMGCQPFTILKIHRLPAIFPTEFMLEKYKEFGKTKSEIYAEVARDIYCTTFGLKKSNLSLLDKNRLTDYLYDFSKMKLD